MELPARQGFEGKNPHGRDGDSRDLSRKMHERKALSLDRRFSAVYLYGAGVRRPETVKNDRKVVSWRSFPSGRSGDWVLRTALVFEPRRFEAVAIPGTLAPVDKAL